MHCDYHIHTEFSADCSMPIENIIKQAQLCGLEEICLTDHLEINFYMGNAWHTNLTKYYEAYRNLKKTAPIKIKFGIEAGVTCKKEDIPELIEEIKSKPFDYVIASGHAIEGVDALNPKYYEGKTRAQMFQIYLEEVFRGLKRLNPSLYSCVGHIDFPAKAMGILNMGNPRFTYREASGQVDELFRYIIALGKCIEINTSSYRAIEDKNYPGFDWLKRYVELGGKYVTFGSDAHQCKQVGNYFEAAVQIAKAAGIKYYATFSNMKPELHKL